MLAFSLLAFYDLLLYLFYQFFSCLTETDTYLHVSDWQPLLYGIIWGQIQLLKLCPCVNLHSYEVNNVWQKLFQGLRRSFISSEVLTWHLRPGHLTGRRRRPAGCLCPGLRIWNMALQIPTFTGGHMECSRVNYGQHTLQESQVFGKLVCEVGSCIRTFMEKITPRQKTAFISELQLPRASVTGFCSYFANYKSDSTEKK